MHLDHWNELGLSHGCRIPLQLEAEDALMPHDASACSASPLVLKLLGNIKTSKLPMLGLSQRGRRITPPKNWLQTSQTGLSRVRKHSSFANSSHLFIHSPAQTDRVLQAVARYHKRRSLQAMFLRLVLGE